METNRRQFIVASSVAIAGTGALSGVGGADTSDAPTPEDTSQHEYPTMGENSDAPVATVYGSFDCPYTSDMVDSSFDEIVSEFVDTGRLQLTFSPLEYDENGNPYISQDGVMGGQAACGVWEEDPESVWDFFAEIWSRQPGDLSRDELEEIMNSAGVDNAGYIADNLENWDPDLEEAADEAWSQGVEFTPTIELKGDLGNREDVVEWIEARLDDDGGQQTEDSEESPSEDTQETEQESDADSTDGSEQTETSTEQDDTEETEDGGQSTSGDSGTDDTESGSDGGSSDTDDSQSDDSGGSNQCGSSSSDGGDAQASQSFVFPQASGSRRTL
ncbi:thioredoxin domain-containing protein [Natronomonas salina]|uniref:DsbA family protein n=1 Tax=Natronomonas salina TaxID=1710540 RepID=UPI0015B59DCF|nr:thioredoxin domain-containing protein [Natronomonas salina]QLD90477.1 thioredoxin domain-containing protein [Natronomonas salina]